MCWENSFPASRLHFRRKLKAGRLTTGAWYPITGKLYFVAGQSPVNRDCLNAHNMTIRSINPCLLTRHSVHFSQCNYWPSDFRLRPLDVNMRHTETCRNTGWRTTKYDLGSSRNIGQFRKRLAWITAVKNGHVEHCVSFKCSPLTAMIEPNRFRNCLIARST